MEEIKRDYYKDGSISYEYHFINGKLHRIDGPAVICYHTNGKIWYKEYYYRGQEVHGDDLFNVYFLVFKYFFKDIQAMGLYTTIKNRIYNYYME